MEYLGKPNINILKAAIIKQAFIDIVKPADRVLRKDINSAMEFMLSDTCEAYCMETGADYYNLRKEAAEAYRRMFDGRA